MYWLWGEMDAGQCWYWEGVMNDKKRQLRKNKADSELFLEAMRKQRFNGVFDLLESWHDYELTDYVDLGDVFNESQQDSVSAGSDPDD